MFLHIKLVNRQGGRKLKRHTAAIWIFGKDAFLTLHLRSVRFTTLRPNFVKIGQIVKK
jgi:hypothetical protein